jgi:cyclic 2,3-diphosphoglycerate synthetase
MDGKETIPEGSRAGERSLRALYLVDGEHHPSTVRDAVERLRRERGWEPAALYFLGGTEKLGSPEEVSVAGAETVFPGDPEMEFLETLDRLGPGLVVDLSDLPVMTPSLRMSLAARAVARGIPYLGADFEFRPVEFADVLTRPSLSVIGTGKRCGKTAVSAELATYLRGKGIRVAVVAMGRGGPAEPYLLADQPVDFDFLLREADRGLHAASDHYEDALVSGVLAVGCRRCGGGMAGMPFVENCLEGARLANGLDVDGVIMEGSGSSLPPVRTDVRLCVVSASSGRDELTGFLGLSRVLISDGVVITMAEEPFASASEICSLREEIERVDGKVTVVRTIFRPYPLKPIRGRKVFVTCTAPEAAGRTLAEYLTRAEGCEVLGISHNLSRRKELASDLGRARGAEVILTELKAAAVDVVGRFAREEGMEVVFFHNRAVPVGGDDLQGFFERMWRLAVERWSGREAGNSR